MDVTRIPYQPEDNNRQHNESTEQERATRFQLFPFDPSNFPDNTEDTLAQRRAFTATQIKESLQDYFQLSDSAREFREVSTRSDHIWVIITDLGMTQTDLPPKEYREAFKHAHERARGLRTNEIGDLMDKYEDHPSLAFIDTISNIAPNNRQVTNELVMLRRSLLVLLDEHS